MTSISGDTTFLKKIFPSIWFGFMTLFLVIVIFANAAAESVLFLIGPIGMLIFGFLLFKKMIWHLVDDVIDQGDSLLIKRGAVEVVLPLSETSGPCAK